MKILNSLTPAVDLLVRLWVAMVFFKSGLTKIQSWDTTILLFTNEYHVPLLSPQAAALFVFNIVAVVSYPELEGAGLEQHYVWGILLLVTLVHGAGALSLDRLIMRFYRPAPARGCA